MEKDELYEFDLRGYKIFRGMLDTDQIQKAKGILDNIKGSTGTGKFSFFGLHPFFAELMALPRTVNIVKSLCGEYARFDHAIGLRMTKGEEQRQGLHGGHRTSQGAFGYEVHQEQIHCGLIKVLYSLTETKVGDGGFCCIPGSHKSGFGCHPRATRNHLVENPAIQPGDMLVFTEALVHGSKIWQADHERFVLIYSYAPGYLAWKDPNTLTDYWPHIKTQAQKDLMRPPFVGNYNENLRQEDGSWPRGRRHKTMTD